MDEPYYVKLSLSFLYFFTHSWEEALLFFFSLQSFFDLSNCISFCHRDKLYFFHLGEREHPCPIFKVLSFSFSLVTRFLNFVLFQICHPLQEVGFGYL